MAVEWPPVPFAQLLAEPVRNGVYKTREFHGRGVKMVNMGELFAYPRLRDASMKRVELSETERAKFCLHEGDLLFARRSLVAEGAGKCSVVLETIEPTAFESSIIRARPNNARADSLFLFYYFNSPIGLHGLDSIRRQVAVAGITGSDLVRLAIQLPPISHQRAIAYILGTLDDKIELNRRMNVTLESMARTIFKDWFVDFGPARAKADGRIPYLAPDIWTCSPMLLTARTRRSGGHSTHLHGWRSRTPKAGPHGIIRQPSSTSTFPPRSGATSNLPLCWIGKPRQAVLGELPRRGTQSWERPDPGTDHLPTSQGMG